MSIMKFTQFLYPNGQRKEVSIDMPSETEVKADELVKAGFAFEIECLTVGNMIHADCCDLTGALSRSVFPNGPEVPKRVEALVSSAYDNWVKWGKPVADSDWLDKLERYEDLL